MWYSDEEQDLLLSDNDPPLLQRHSSLMDVVDSEGRKSQVRTVFIPHHQESKLPKLPTVVLIHGIGGQLTQFDAIIDYLAHFSEVLALDLPGSGKSEDAPSFSSYAPDSFVNYIDQAIEHFVSDHKEVVLVGHSLGCVHVLRLSRVLGPKCVGCILITPAVVKLRKSLQALVSWMPCFIFDYVVRVPDKRGGLESPSVRRMVSPSTTSQKTLRRQLICNLQSRSRPFLSIVSQLRPLSQAEVDACSCPVLIITAQHDQVTPPSQGRELGEQLKQHTTVKLAEVSQAGHAVCLERPEVVNGLVGDFIRSYIDERLSASWQLAYLASDKHGLKNEQKWMATEPVGGTIAPANLRGMKTMRENDPVHSPAILEREYPGIAAVIDISREKPPYEESSFKRIAYYKFATVSKVPPSKEEVRGFIDLVDSIPRCPEESIAVHCHYGFNRTGFLIVAYLIEKHGFSVRNAVDTFAQTRSPGIKHVHFIDELFVRYEL